jgi:lysyl-tRNA synthetase class 2
VLVGGRVVSVSPRELVVADALAAVRVSLASVAATEVPVTPGDLVVVEGTRGPAGLRDARITLHSSGVAPGAESEFGRLALDGVGRRLAARALALRTVRDYFDGEGFIEVETPVRVPSPGLDAHVEAVRVDGGSGGWLITSPELHMKRLVVGGLPRVYQVAHTTRAGEEGPLHEPEFALLEWYRAFAGMDAVVRDTEALISAIVRELGGRPTLRLPDGRRISVKAPFPRLTVREAFLAHAGIRDAAELARTDEDRYFQLFVDRVEPALARLTRPVVLSEFPITEAALARPCPHDPTVAERFEIYVGGVELCNGFGELTDAGEQRRRFGVELARRRLAGAPLHPIDERFLSALEEGLPPSAGNALGLDRLVALALGVPRIADVMAFPRARL